MSLLFIIKIIVISIGVVLTLPREEFMIRHIVEGDHNIVERLSRGFKSKWRRIFSSINNLTCHTYLEWLHYPVPR
jgi:hypothetical protein